MCVCVYLGVVHVSVCETACAHMCVTGGVCVCTCVCVGVCACVWLVHRQKH